VASHDRRALNSQRPEGASVPLIVIGDLDVGIQQLQIWKAEARKLGEAHGAIADVSRDVLRRVLIQLNLLFLKAPGEIRRAYKNLSEKRLAVSQQQRTDVVNSGSLGWTLPEHDDAASIAEALGGQIRAIDWRLFRQASQFPFEVSYWLAEGDEFYVIPRSGVSKDRLSKKGQPYEKRGMFNHRIVPSEIDGYRVEVVESRTLRLSATADPSEWIMGACVFAGLDPRPKFTHVNDDKYFIIDHLICDTANDTVDEQMEKALADNCMAVVWPELSVPPPLRQRIEDRLRRVDIVDTRERPEIVVAGSWHEPKEGGHVNRAHIYDGYGKHLAVYDKIEPYYDSRWGTEKISPGKTLCILATEAALIGFAICLDFCEVNSNPFTELDIDLMLVPSMGNDETMRGHQLTAKRISVRFGARSFVVQQITETEYKDGRLGIILPPIQKPDMVSVEKLGQNEVWKSYNWPPTA
jgi:hypothetical protein